MAGEALSECLGLTPRLGLDVMGGARKTRPLALEPGVTSALHYRSAHRLNRRDHHRADFANSRSSCWTSSIARPIEVARGPVAAVAAGSVVSVTLPTLGVHADAVTVRWSPAR